METFDTDRILRNLAERLSFEIGVPSNKPDFSEGKIILLAYPTFIESHYSIFPITSMDGEDWVREDREARKIVHTLQNYNEERIFNEWKSQTYKHQVVAFSACSAEALMKQGFHEVTPHFSFIRFPTYAFVPQA
ncbi:hypothetical protein HY450_02705 [Candidatus Pacearchaeota archaeon]|nr:hypothetical protein [Candidatus Pacearchaeota archaeon]